MDIEIKLNNTIVHKRVIPHSLLNPSKVAIPIAKQKNLYEDEISSSDDDDSSDSFEEMEEDIDEDEGIGSESGSSSLQRKQLRKYGSKPEDDYLYGLSNNKKPKRDLTEEEIAKKTEQTRIRKLHAKKQLEEEKRETIERILNEDGRKLRERQKKMNEENFKREQALEEKYKFSLTKIKHKYLSNGSVYVRFPQGFLVPEILFQKVKELTPIPKCDVDTCSNNKKYTDPVTKKHYCSVSCFKIIRDKYNKNGISN